MPKPVRVQKILFGWLVDGYWCPTEKVRDHWIVKRQDWWEEHDRLARRKRLHEAVARLRESGYGGD